MDGLIPALSGKHCGLGFSVFPLKPQKQPGHGPGGGAGRDAGPGVCSARCLAGLAWGCLQSPEENAQGQNEGCPSSVEGHRCLPGSSPWLPSCLSGPNHDSFPRSTLFLSQARARLRPADKDPGSLFLPTVCPGRLDDSSTHRTWPTSSRDAGKTMVTHRHTARGRPPEHLHLGIRGRNEVSRGVSPSRSLAGIGSRDSPPPREPEHAQMGLLGVWPWEAEPAGQPGYLLSRGISGKAGLRAPWAGTPRWEVWVKNIPFLPWLPLWLPPPC